MGKEIEGLEHSRSLRSNNTAAENENLIVTCLIKTTISRIGKKKTKLQATGDIIQP